MSHLIPPLVSNSPPPIISGGPDEPDDEFGDFAVPGDNSFDAYSLPSSPLHLPNTFLVDNTPIPDNPKDLPNGDIKCVTEIANDVAETVPKVQKTISENVNNISEINLVSDQTNAVSNSSEISEVICVEESETSHKNTTGVDFSNDQGAREETDDFGEFISKSEDDRQVSEVDTLETELITETNNLEIIETPKNYKEPDDYPIPTNEFIVENISSTTENSKHKNDSDLNNFRNFKTTEAIKNDSDFGTFEDFTNENDSNNTDLNPPKSQIYDPIVSNLETFEDDSPDFNIKSPNFENDIPDLNLNPHEADTDLPDLDLKYEEPEDDDFDDFGDFECSIPEPKPSISKDEPIPEPKAIEFEANFDDFQSNKEDDFGGFNDCASTSAVNLSRTKEELVEIMETMIKEIFKSDETVYPEFQAESYTENNPVFHKLKVIENTHALNFQWNNSEGQNMLLKSLNIDSRNILYGPRWNPSMPKFASNLGFEPLEPQKTDLPTVQTQNEPQQVEVPDAKFDWTSSGLVNPLDCSPDDMLLDLEQLVTSLDLAPTTSSSFLTATTTLAPPPIPAVNSPVDDYQTWDHWLQCQSSKENVEDKQNISNTFKLPETDILMLQSETNPSLPQSDNESVNSLKFVTNDNDNENQNNEEDYNNFEAYKTEDVNWSPVNLQPLRESRISEENREKIDENDDDFTDFQMSLPSVTKPVETIPLPRLLKPSNVNTKSLDPFGGELDPLSKKTIVKPVEPMCLEVRTPEKVVFNKFQTGKTIEKSVEKTLEHKEDNIEKTFEKSTDVGKFETILPPLEPLKPIILQPTVLSTAPAKIEWPEPGIIDDIMISEIDITYIAKNSNKNDLNQVDNIKIDPVKTDNSRICSTTDEVTEDDDWSDFVSVTKPQQTIQTQSKDCFAFLKSFSNNQTQQLSISNLQNTQTTYKSLPQMQPPVVSPVHKLNPIPSTQQIAVQQFQTGYQPPFQIPLQQQHPNPISIEGTEFEPSYKPSPIISNLDGFMMSPKKNPQPPIQSISVFQPLHSVENSFLNLQQSTLPSTTDDDDDWTDFVSHPTVAPQTATNGWTQKSQVRTITGHMKPNYSGWHQNVEPNIITNPVHFDVFQSYQSGGQKCLNNNKKPQIPGNGAMNSILPELDFASPKNKFFTKK